MTDSGMPPKKTKKPGLIPIIAAGLAFLGAISPHGLHAQETITKATETVTVSGATPIGEIIVAIPNGSELSGLRSGDTLTIHKGPFSGSVPIQRTALGQTNTPPSTVSPPSTATSPVPKSDNSKLVAQQGDLPLRESFWDFCNNPNLLIPATLAFSLIVITIALIVIFSIRSVRHRRDHLEQQRKLRDELQMVRHDLLELHRILDVSKKLNPDTESPQTNSEIAECPHCNSGFPVTSLQNGANTCPKCGEAFLYQ